MSFYGKQKKDEESSNRKKNDPQYKQTGHVPYVRPPFQDNDKA